MKKNIFILFYLVSACLLFADAKDELGKIIDNGNTEEFSKANEHIDELQEQGKQYVSQGKYEKALKCYRKALAESDKLFGKNSTAAASSYMSMAIPYIKMGKKIKAAEVLVKASEIFKKSMGKILRPHNYYVLRLQAANIYCDSKKYTIALGILKELEQEIKQVPMARRAKVYCLLAECFYTGNKFTEAIKYCEMANKEPSSDINTDDLKAENYDVWASCLTSLKKRKKAIATLQKCIKYAAKAKRSNKFMGQMFQNMGLNYIYLKDYSNAKKNLDKALKCFENVQEDTLYWKGITYLLIARNARFACKWKEAEENYEKAVGLLEKYLISVKQKKLNSAFCGICVVFQWIPKCYLQNHKLEKIEVLYPKLGMLKKINNISIDLGNVYSSWATFYVMLGKYDMAIYLSDCGLKIFRALPQDEYTKKKIGNLLWSKAKALHLSGKREQAFHVGTRAYNILVKFYSKNPRITKVLKDMLKNMKNGTPFERGGN